MNKGGILNYKRMVRLDSQAGGQEEDQGDQIHRCSEGGYGVSRCKRTWTVDIVTSKESRQKNLSFELSLMMLMYHGIIEVNAFQEHNFQ